MDSLYYRGSEYLREGKTKSAEEKVEKIDDVHYVVHVKDPPEKGKANERVIYLLSGHFSISKSHIHIISGVKSRLKVVTVLI